MAPRRRRPIAIGLGILLFIGAGYAGACEVGRVILTQNLSRFFSTSIQIRRLTVLPQRLVLHQVTFPVLSLKRLQIERPFQKSRSVTITGLTLGVAGIPLHAQGRVDVTANGRDTATCEGWLTFEHPLLKGRLEVSGPVTEPVLLGWFATLKGVRRRFVAQLLIRPEGIRLAQMEIEGGWKASGIFARPAGSTYANGKLKVEGPGNRFTLEVEPNERESGRLSLLLEGNQEISRKITALWTVRRNVLSFEAAFLGEEARLRGRIELDAPHQMEMTLALNSVSMEELFQPFFKGGASPISGQMKGEVEVTGTPAHLVSRGVLTSQDGKFYQTPFTWAAVRFFGMGPVLKIQNSQLTKPTGVLLIEGMVDLRRLGQPDFFSRVHLSSVQNSLELAGWEMSPTPGTQGLQMRRSATQGQAKVNLAYRQDAQIGSEALERQQVEVEYPLSPEEQVNVRMSGQEEFVGLEHHRKF